MVENNKIRSYACINKDEIVRKNSSSGGCFYELAYEIIKNGGVVFASKYNKEFGVEFGICEKVEDICLYIGSKYCQSKLGDSYLRVKEYLEKGTRVLFVGTPCQVNGLKKYLNGTYGDLILIDFICHGIPQQAVWNKYLEYLNRRGKIKSISFRDKSISWHKFSLKVCYENGDELLEEKWDNSYLRGFLEGLFLKKACYNCSNKGMNRESDITLADFWGINLEEPDMFDGKGTSAVFCNTDKGQELFRRIQDRFIIKEIQKERIIKHNKNYFEDYPMHKNYTKFMKKLDSCSDVNEWIEICLKEGLIQRIINRIGRKISK